jgi:NADH-dependent peroxiredoxin subunit F
LEKIYDLIIVGAGPAGITAAVYAARKQMNFIVLTGDVGGQAAWSSDIENYTGYQFISGIDLAGKFEEHISQYGITVQENEFVVEIERSDKGFSVITKKAEYKAMTVIIASGAKSKELGVPGEQEYRNKGLTYCATCDGPLFAGKTVAVIGGGNSALDAVLQLEKIVQKIYMINITNELGGDPVMREKVTSSEKVDILNNTSIVEIRGETFVNAIGVKTSEATQDLEVQGVFVEIGLTPNSDLAKDISKNEKDEIIVNCKNETNVEGLFAAGDVTNVPEKQIIIAAGDGAKAALGAFKYLARKKEDLD